MIPGDELGHFNPHGGSFLAKDQTMLRCRTCVMPNTRPDTPFIDGECSACVSYRKRATVDWDARKAELLKILDRHDGRCIVPSSGGKDSTWQVLKLLELGADVTVVTARTCHLTPIGRANIDNLARYARTIEVVPNMTVRAKLNRLALEMVGDISWPEHCAIFSTPFRVSAELKIPLLFYGECPQEAYGGPIGTDEARQMTRRWVSEFGGFLGLRPDDFIGVEGITGSQMSDYNPVPWGDWGIAEPEAYFLGQFFEWDSRRNAMEAEAAGMLSMVPTNRNWWRGENLDNAQTGLHDWFMLRKYGFGRGCQQISVDVRTGACPRQDALPWAYAVDFGPAAWAGPPEEYANVRLDDVLDRIGMSRERLLELARRFTA